MGLPERLALLHDDALLVALVESDKVDVGVSVNTALSVRPAVTLVLELGDTLGELVRLPSELPERLALEHREGDTVPLVVADMLGERV